jgi:multicomponent K+:H+ antiporter subunit E
VSRLVPYPVLTASLLLMWMLLTRFSLGHLILGSAVALAATQAMFALTPAKPRVRRWDRVPVLVGVVLYDVLRSNLAVAGLILNGGRSGARRSGFIEIRLTLRDRTALAVLAVVLTSTPGTAWMDYDVDRGVLVLHVFDLVGEDDWIDLVTNRYERLLIEIFE